ncbi:MAG: hypothetical protein LUD25_05420 [Coriobacteriaceae bacterium]|nr:hypothetical protein [Coriobacteriaceae bacterium]
MAKISTDGLASLKLSFEELASIPDSVLTNMVDAEADVIVTAQKAKARSMGVVDTGAMVASITKGKVSKSSDGVSIEVLPQGSVHRGGKTYSLSERAFLNEFGTRHQAPRPFIKQANEESMDKALSAAEKIYDNYLKTKNL